MKWSSTHSDCESLEDALDEIVSPTLARLGTNATDLALVFFSRHHQPDAGMILERLRASIDPGILIGCSAGGVIGGEVELENGPGISLVCAHLPGVDIQTFDLRADGIPDLDVGPSAWHELLGLDSSRRWDFVLLGDPHTYPVDSLTEGIDFAFPGATVVGGLASSDQRSGNTLLLNDSETNAGLVGIALSGNIRVRPLVAQGCRPIGEPLTITKTNGNILVEVDGRPPLSVLQDIFNTMDTQDRDLIRRALHLGIATALESLEPGEFLVRNIMGVDQTRGILAIGAEIREGQVVQFHVRDRNSASRELRDLLSIHDNGAPAAGALLFSCLGRGQRLFGVPNHDTGLFREAFGPVPIGGFFCSGEIGPVGGNTHLHGFTSAFALFSAV